MTQRSVLFALIFFYFFSLPTLAVSFDCTKASTDIEHAICSSSALGVSDNSLASNFRQAIANLSVIEGDELRKEQLVWLKTRNACAEKPEELFRCLMKSIEQRSRELELIYIAGATSLDNVIRTIPFAPASAAQTLRKYRSSLTSAWLVYLYQFEPGSGVASDEAIQYQQHALDKVMGRHITDVPAIDTTSTLDLLRRGIEAASYEKGYTGGTQRKYVHCFIFERHGEAALEAFGPQHASYRDAFSPICSPQGSFFKSYAWDLLHKAIRPAVERAQYSEGSIRYSFYASWDLFELDVSVLPKKYLLPDPENAHPERAQLIASYGDLENNIRAGDWDEKLWPLEERKAVLKEIPHARKDMEYWLQTEKYFSTADAKKAADKIVSLWLIQRVLYIDGHGAHRAHKDSH
ncbi:lysozyme inhibitor LprI family protein [Kluyvera sichuanensis]|uniref:lysozyme inhibitor LprI family protein n=1 Tax=Kluyvera sichuanensis TaxID=2725494 RepID=UPI003F67CE5D